MDTSENIASRDATDADDVHTGFSDWSSGDSEILYGVRGWGAGYFGISESGMAEVQVPFGEETVSVPILDIINGIKDRGMDMPVVLRIENLLDHNKSDNKNNSKTHLHLDFKI